MRMTAVLSRVAPTKAGSVAREGRVVAAVKVSHKWATGITTKRTRTQW